mgnify:FL=1
MAFYGDGKHNINMLSKIERGQLKAKKRRENKNKLLLNVVYMLFGDDSYDYDSFKQALCREALAKRTQKELKEILYGN